MENKPDEQTVRLVRQRDRNRCARCGTKLHWSGMSVHHRHLRSHPYPRLHQPENLVLLCGSGTTGCHGWVHAHPREAYETGYMVHGWDTHPEQTPIIRADGREYYLQADGTQTTSDPTPLEAS